MSKKTLLSLAVIVFAGFAGISFSSAHGGFGWMGMGNFDPEKFAERQQAMFENQAETLGIEITKIKNYWAEGKNFREMAEAEGISDEELREKMKVSREKEMSEKMQALVSGGVITQEQADARLEMMKEKMANGKFGRGMISEEFARHKHGGCRISNLNNTSNNQQ